MSPIPVTLLEHLEQRGTAPRGEVAVDVEAAARAGADEPVPVLLLTDRALYAHRAHSSAWERLPLDRIGRVSSTVDPSGILTRYEVVDAGGATWLDLAVAFARPSFRQSLRQAATRLTPREAKRLEVLRSRRGAHVVVTLRLAA